tara:strand:+ start:10520 stop:13324 length:2805 start_codon:yes stop_codon:yes gene_type:complete
LRIKLLKNILIIFTLTLVSVNSFAKDLQVETNAAGLTLTTPESIKNVVFKRFNDLWVIYSDKSISVKFDKAKMQALGITSVEKLITKNGSGFRFRFNKEIPHVHFLHDYDKRTMAIQISAMPAKNKKSNTIKFRVSNIKGDKSLKQLFLDSSYVLDYAYSLQTGEKYVVAISNDTRFRYPTKQINQDLYFLPTYSGAVMISEYGEYLKIIDDEVVQLVDKEDSFFRQAAETLSSQSLDQFFYDSGISLIERQVRDYSVFNRAIDGYKADKKYDTAITRLDNALSSVEDLNYLVSARKPAAIQVAPKRLDLITIQEGDVFDMSGEDDGLFEMEDEEKRTLKVHEKSNEEILVPDFSSDNLSFLMEKLRLSSIKQTGSKQKEKINIKRMQINAFKGYFAEILDLTRLVKLDISGEFPRNNKSLALYTLASAKMGRCNRVIPLPEKSGDIYTKDIRLWKAYCMVKQKKFDTALTLFKRDSDRILTYPTKLREDLMIAYAITLRNTDNYKHSTAILQDLEKETVDFVEEVKFNLALNYLYQNESTLAQEEFEKLVFAENKVIRFKARLEYLNLLLQSKGKIDKNSIIQALEELRFDFRGNDTELEATKVLASVYLQEDYIKEAMELYKYISIYFAKTPASKQATEILFNIFYNLFAKNQVLNSNMNSLDRLALFYDFIELTPSEYEGNQIISNVVGSLIRLGLYDNAIKLLTIQLNYKTEDPDIAQSLGEKLADLYVKTGQYKNALKTLELTQKFKDVEDYTDAARLIKANILLKQAKLKDAEALLKSLPNSLDAKYTLAEIYWHNNQYEDIIETLENIFLGKKVELDEEGIVNLSYLMLSYALTKDVEKLQQIKDLYLEELKKVDLEHKIEFLLKLAGMDVQIEQEDNSLLDVWQDVIRIDNQSINFLDEYQDEVLFRQALEARDLETLVKYKDKLD